MRGDPPVVFDLVEKPFDEIALMMNRLFDEPT
jgi:hypothetical protein